MAAIDTTAPAPFDSEKPTSRKRKQDFSAEVAKTPWSDYVYSSPSSPSQQVPLPPSSGCDMFDQVHQPDYDLNLDSILAQGYDFGNNHNINVTHGSASQFAADPASRRHSVAVGELDYKQEYDIRRFDTDLQQLLGMPPSSWSSSSSSSTNEPLQTPQQQQQPMPHRRTMSLRLETSLPHVSSEQSPSTPSFFSPSFLDALNADDTPGQGFQAGVSFMDSTDLNGMTPSPSASSAEFLLQHQQVSSTTVADSNTIAPSAISHPWVQPQPQDQYQQPQPQQQQQQRRRSSKVKLSPSSPPQSPSNTVTSSMSSSSPSPPITPMTLSGLYQVQHPAIPEEDEDMVDHHHPHAQQHQHPHQQQQQHQQHKMYPMDVKLSKSSMVTARMLQGANSANALRPHIQQYLLSNDPAGSGERTVMVLTSKVAQKSYGTEKR